MKDQCTPTPWKYVSEYDEAYIDGPEPSQKGMINFYLCDTAVGHANAAFIVRAVNRDDLFETLLKFAKEMHETCFECEGTGRIWKHADPSTGQWCCCPYAEAIAKAEAKEDAHV